MFTHQCAVSLASVYIEPNHKAELFTQLLMADPVVVLDRKGSWALVELVWNGDQGWVLFGQLKPVETLVPFDGLVDLDYEHNPLAGSFLHLKTPYKQVFSGNWLTRYEQACRHQGLNPIQLIAQESEVDNKLMDVLTSFQACFVHAPYLWGGLSLYGIDCSGLAQLFYRYRGIPLPHTASKQVALGAMVDFITEVKPGDLAFFDEAGGQITHVGIMLSSQQILHASAGNGKVQVDAIDMEGIVNTEGRRTHHLRMIRRLEV